MDKAYTPDEIIADLKELIASIEEIKNDPKPEPERVNEITRQIEHIADKNIAAWITTYAYAKRYGHIDPGLYGTAEGVTGSWAYEPNPDGAVEAEK